MPLILPGNVASATAAGYTVANSVRFDDGDNARISKTFSSAGNLDTWTMSAWVKRCNLGANSSIFTCNGLGAAAQKGTIRFDSSDKISAYVLYADSAWHYITSDAVYRDTAAWYHIVVRCDTTQSTNTDRLRLYVNGKLQTLSGSTYPDQNEDTFFNEAEEHQVGSLIDETEDGDMFLAEFCWIDGSSLAPTSFGEYDSDSPNIWKPIDVSGLTFGTNGVYLDFEDSSDFGKDASGNSDWTATNLPTNEQATDTPTNSFANMNILDNYYANSTFSEGNCRLVQGSGTYAHNISTIAVTAGKWYAEAKLTTDSEHALVGITDTPATATGTVILGSAAHDYSIKQANGDLFNNRGDDPSNDATDYAGAYAQNDIIGIALDCDNNKLYFSKGGAWSDGSGSWDSTTFNASVGAITITAPASTDNGHYFFASGDYGSASCTWEWNFGGCPPFSISSSNADANGYGSFEYSVPSGFLALCTQNLGSDGG